MASAVSEAEGPATGDAQKAAAARGVAARSTWVQLAVLVAAVQLAGVGAIAGITWAIVAHHKEVTVVAGALTAQGDPRARPVATSEAMRAWELRHIRLLTVEQLLALRFVTVPLNETAAKSFRIRELEAHGAQQGGPPHSHVVLGTDSGETLHVTAMRGNRDETWVNWRPVGAPENHSAEPTSVVEPAPTMLSLSGGGPVSASERSDGSGRTLELQAQHPDGTTVSPPASAPTGLTDIGAGGKLKGAAFHAEDRGVVVGTSLVCQKFPGACTYFR